jgi:hypothetical protein
VPLACDSHGFALHTAPELAAAPVSTEKGNCIEAAAVSLYFGVGLIRRIFQQPSRRHDVFGTNRYIHRVTMRASSTVFHKDGSAKHHTAAPQGAWRLRGQPFPTFRVSRAKG